MAEPRILRVRTVHSHPDYDSGTYHFTVRSKIEPDKRTLYMLDIVPYHCSHEHDCCGCVQTDSGFVARHSKRNEWYVEQYFYRNV